MFVLELAGTELVFSAGVEELIDGADEVGG